MINQELVQEKVSRENGRDITISLRDGTQLEVRPAEMSDIELIKEMHKRLSKNSIYYRYLGPYKPTTKDLEYQCSLDGGPGLALVAKVHGSQEQVVAVACYRGHPSNPNTVEPAILVEDDFQGRGLGKRLFLALCNQATRRGVEVFESYAHPNNQPILHMIQSCELHCESRYNDGLREIRIWLQ